MKHTLSILVQNRSGELARIVGLFSARGYNIESLTVAETLDPRTSRVTLVTTGDDQTLEQISKQLEKQIRVLSVTDLSMLDHIERELALIQVNAAGRTGRQEAMHLVDIFRANVIDVSENALTIETTGDRAKLESLLGLLRPLGVKEMVRAGTVAIPKLAAAGGVQNSVAEFAVR